MTTPDQIASVAAVPPDVERAHRDLSALDWELRRRVLTAPEGLERATFAAIQVPADFLYLPDFPFQSWPTLADRPFADHLAAVTVELVRLVKSLPARLYGNDPARLSQAYDGVFPPPLLELLLAEPSGIAPAVARGDFILDQDALKCLEVNLSANIGGWEVALVAHQYLAVPLIARFLAEHRMAAAHVDPVEELFAHVVAESTRRVRDLGSEVNVALIADGAPPLPATAVVESFLTDRYRRALERSGLRGSVVSCATERLRVTDGVVMEGAKRIHGLLEISVVRRRPELYRAFKASRVALFNGPLEQILSHKRNLVFLSEGAEEGPFDPRERELIARHVPWTRELERGETHYRGQRVELPGFVLEHRGELVVKPVLERGGKGVVVGHAVGADEWRGAVEVAVDQGGFVVQEQVRSRRYLYQHGPRGATAHEMVWGPFCFGERYGGVLLRMQPDVVGGPVNVSQRATAGCLFEVQPLPGSGAG